MSESVSPILSQVFYYGDIVDIWKAPEKTNYSFVDKETFIGIEIEVENVRVLPVSEEFRRYWKHKEDGSLRNNGVEFITPPIRGDLIPHVLNVFFREHKKLKNVLDFSERTSIHIHVDARPLSFEQIRTWVLAYSILEPLLFSVSSPKRENNIFCVPIGDTMFWGVFDRFLKDDSFFEVFINTYWTKYSALNLRPLVEENNRLGTIEFRHMEGTSDEHKLLNWINYLLAVRSFALDKTVPWFERLVNELITDSQYVKLIRTVFPRPLSELLINSPDFLDRIKEGVNRTKDFFINKKEVLSGFLPNDFESFVKSSFGKKLIKLLSVNDNNVPNISSYQYDFYVLFMNKPIINKPFSLKKGAIKPKPVRVAAVQHNLQEHLNNVINDEGVFAGVHHAPGREQVLNAPLNLNWDDLQWRGADRGGQINIRAPVEPGNVRLNENNLFFVDDIEEQ